MAKAADASAAYENPLIPNARLRQIYLAMLRARMLEKALPAARRARAVAGHAVVMAGLEACLASTSVDLGPGDLVSDALNGGVAEFLRGASLGAVLRPEKVSRKRGAHGLFADCGAAATLPGGSGIADRLWLAMGAAAALKAAAAQAKISAKTEAGTAPRLGVVVAYVRPSEAPAVVWRKALGFAAEQELPIVFVAMPAARGGAAEAETGGVSALSLRCGVPGIAVDQDDAVAIYRVAQESIGRARAGGGAALIECVPFVLDGMEGKRSEDAILALGRYLLHRKICTSAWMDRAATSFAKQLRRRK